MKKTLWYLSLLAFALQVQAMSAKRPVPEASWTLTERFGVSHPDQIVYLDLPADTKSAHVANSVLQDAEGKTVPFQLMGKGQLAIRTDLPAGSSRHFLLKPGISAPCPDPVVIIPAKDYVELTNGVIGLRIPACSNNTNQTPSPIQGIRLQDRVWTAVGPNVMNRPAKNMTVEWLEKGPLVARVRIAYIYDKAPLRSARPEVPAVPAGEGTYSVVIEMQSGQPSILFEEDCEVDIGYRVNITEGLAPTRAQYRGHHATSPESGHEEDGSLYQYQANVRHDALVDLDYSGKTTNRWSGTSYPFMSHWDPWGVDTGYYWQLYSTHSSGSDNLFGIFAGRASRLINTGVSGVSFDTTATNGNNIISLQVKFQRMMPTQYYSTRIRFGWGLFLGRKSVDLKPVNDVQGINRQMNLHAGVNLNSLYRLPGEFPDPPSGYGSLYVKSDVWKRIASQLQAEAAKGSNTLYNALKPDDPSFLDFWRDPTGDVVRASVQSALDYGTMFLETLVNGQGIYRHETHYFMGCLRISAALLWFDQLLGSDAVPVADKQKLKQLAALYGVLLWNNDLSPMQPKSGSNLGPANMSSMWLGTRYSYTLFLARHPFMKPHLELVRQDAIRQLHAFVNEAGACSASAHYTGASMIPILNLVQQLQMAKVADLCATDPRLSRYAEWEMQLMSPPDLRFGGRRKIIAVGDGSTEFSTRPGQLGTAFASANPELSARLMGAHQAMGSPSSTFFGSTYLKIDPALPAVSPRLGSADFPGWMSVFRSGWETPEETAVYFINGTSLSDHRHNDNGSLVIYALGAPLSLDWGPIYYPRVSGGLMHSMVLPESMLDRSWTADNTSLDLPAGGGGVANWWQTDRTPFLSFTESGSVSATFHWQSKPDTQWSRTVRLLSPVPATPVILVEDAFTEKENRDKPMVSTLNMMAQGPVTTPSGAVTPEARLYDRQDKARQQLPSAGVASPLPAGVSSLQFTGQYLIDWDLVADCAGPAELSLGNWANNWNQALELNQFQKAMGTPYEERQHILRLRTSAPARLILLPYAKGKRPDPCTVTKTGDSTVIRLGDLTLTLGEGWYSSRRGDRVSLTTWSEAVGEAEGIRLGGGPMEVVLDGRTGTLTSLLGKVEGRTVTLPSGWQIDPKEEYLLKQDASRGTIKLVRIP